MHAACRWTVKDKAKLEAFEKLQKEKYEESN